MPQKPNRSGEMQEYIPKGNGDASGEYGTSKGTNKDVKKPEKKEETKSKANVIEENSNLSGKKDVQDREESQKKEEVKANIIDKDLTEVEDSYEFESDGKTKDVKKMVEMMYEIGINPVDKDWDKNVFKNAEKLTEAYFDTGKVKLAQKMTKGRSAKPRDIMVASFMHMQDALRMAFMNDSFSKWFEKTEAKYKK